MLCDHLFLFPIFSWRLLCVLYIVIGFDTFQTFWDLKLLMKELLVCFKDFLNVNMKHFLGSFAPERHTTSCFYHFCFSKNDMPILGHGYATAYIFHKRAFKLTMSRDCLMVWVEHFLRKTFFNNINNCTCNK